MICVTRTGSLGDGKRDDDEKIQSWKPMPAGVP